jgi:hypothetical protein
MEINMSLRGAAGRVAKRIKTKATKQSTIKQEIASPSARNDMKLTPLLF